MTNTPGPWEWRGEPEFGRFFNKEGNLLISGDIDGDLAFENKDDISLVKAAPGMLEALELAQRMVDEALPKFSWGAPALDANTVPILNNAAIAIRIALAKAKGQPS